MIGCCFCVLGGTGWHRSGLGGWSPQVGARRPSAIGLGLALRVVEHPPESRTLALARIGDASPPRGACMRLPRLPAALIAIVFAVAMGIVFGLPTLSIPADAGGMPSLVGLPSWSEVERASPGLRLAAAGTDLHERRHLDRTCRRTTISASGARDVTPRRLSISSGLGNDDLRLLYAATADVPRSEAAARGALRFRAPSNRATLSTARCELLAYLFPQRAEFIRAIGKEAGDSRIWAGIHYEMDNQSGVALGNAVAGKFIERAKSDGAD